MSGLFRSQEMTYVSITASNDVAYDTLRALGKAGKFHMVEVALCITNPLYLPCLLFPRM